MPSPSGSSAPSFTPSPFESGVHGFEPSCTSTALRTPSRSESVSPSEMPSPFESEFAAEVLVRYSS
jgi:hypothetical protein